MEGKGPSVLTDLADTAGGEPEHVLHQPVSIGVQRYQLLLDELLVALGGQAQGDRAETAAVVRAGNNERSVSVLSPPPSAETHMHTSDLTSCWNCGWSFMLTINIQSPAIHRDSSVAP